MTTNLVLLHHLINDPLLVKYGISLAFTLRIGDQGFFQFFSKTDVIDNEPAGFILPYPVYPGDCLHEGMALHGLVDIHGMQTGNIKTGQPHITDNCDFEWIFRIFKPFCKEFPA